MNKFGVMTPLVTPVKEDGVNVDRESLERLIEFQLENGVTSLLTSAGTGEVMFSSRETKRQVMKFTVEIVRHRVPVAAGIVEITADEAIKSAKEAKATGVDCLLISTPFGSDITGEGCVEFYKAIDNAVNMPIMVYNYPGHTNFNTTPDILGALIDAVPNIIGIKECACSMAQTMEDVIRFGDRIQIISGNEFLAPWEMLFGAHGCILASPNLLPKEWVEIYEAALEKNSEKVIELAGYIFSMQKTLFKTINPGPLKYALGLIGIPVGVPISPCTDTTENVKQALENELKIMGKL